MRGAIEQSVSERVDDGGDKDKKKKRRSNWRTKLNVSASTSASFSSVNDELSAIPVNSSTSPELHGFYTPPRDGRPSTNGAFNSLSIIFTSKQFEHLEMKNLKHQHIFPSNVGERVVSTQSCPEPVAHGDPSAARTRFHLPPSSKIDNHCQKKYFSPHWSMEAINEALQKGDVFRALFRVNAHNRLEAYCKIEGVPIDVLISGISSQNRAVEGDAVAVKIELLSLWGRLKGSTEICNNSSVVEDSDLLLENNKTEGQTFKGQTNIEPDFEHDGHRSSSYYSKGLCNENNELLDKTIHLNHSPPNCDNIDIYQPDGSHLLLRGTAGDQNKFLNAVGGLCATINSFPSKRPTGRVVGIIERSSRRNTIVGYLDVKQFYSYVEFYSKETKKSNGLLSFSDHQYIQLTPIDPRFSKMVVLVELLPDCIKKRLEDNDATLERELVAARIDDWSEESFVPQALVLNVLGRGNEMKSQIDAILFDNAIHLGDFSVDALSCLPHTTWQIPEEEFLSRRDLRNLCIFTIDPSTASDLDDALSVERLDNGICRVGVHISDASYFVLPDTPLDLEAQLRSTNVYLPQRKVRMLPPLLSKNIGSLKPGVDRLAFSIFFYINHDGDVINRWIGRTVICSCCKLSYEHAQSIIDEVTDFDNLKVFGNGSPELHGQFGWLDVIQSVKLLNEVSRMLKEKRFSCGALRLESSKISFLFDEDGLPCDTMFCERKDSNFIVEEFMLLANLTAAEVISKVFPDNALLRKHPGPNLRKLREFEAFCSKHGLELKTSSSKQFHQSLELIREKLKDDSLLFDILISYASRPMQLATYFCTGELKDGETDWSHYALAVPVYTHFTSPLRRYPDILVHRMLAAALEAEELYLKHQTRVDCENKCFTGVHFNKNAAESVEGRAALSIAALKHKVPCTELLANIAAHCNERKLACRRVKDACDKLCMWFVVRKNEVLFSNARVLGLGPRFMSVYIYQLAIEQRLYYDEVEGLTVEWLDNTSTLVLNLNPNRRTSRRGGQSNRWRVLEDVALVVPPYDSRVDETSSENEILDTIVDPAVFPLTVRLLSKIPVALHAMGGDDGPVEIGARLYMSSYFK